MGEHYGGWWEGAVWRLFLAAVGSMLFSVRKEEYKA